MMICQSISWTAPQFLGWRECGATIKSNCNRTIVNTIQRVPKRRIERNLQSNVNELLSIHPIECRRKEMEEEEKWKKQIQLNKPLHLSLAEKKNAKCTSMFVQHTKHKLWTRTQPKSTRWTDGWWLSMLLLVRVHYFPHFDSFPAPHTQTCTEHLCKTASTCTTHTNIHVACMCLCEPQNGKFNDIQSIVVIIIVIWRIYVFIRI